MVGPGGRRRTGPDDPTVAMPRIGVVRYQTPEYHPAFEEYCETIFELAEDDVELIQARIAERLDVSRPAVSEMVKRLEKAGLVSTDDAGIALTDDGRELATSVVRRHRLAERFLTDVLGLTWTEAHHEAGKWEHVISPAVESALDRLLGQPTTCPHGNPIPGSSYREPDTRNLSDVGVGELFTVSRIPEELEFAEGLLQFLEDASLMPGEQGSVTASDDGGMTVEIGGGRVEVQPFAADRILVTTR
jgi:DtxR family Mn-dependent transcriptional regulator